MKSEASFTASMIAVARGLGETLPEDARLAFDPYGVRFATRWLGFVARHARVFLPLLERILLAVQVRTRTIDDLLLGFLKDGGAQVLLLGAGFDCRASRFAAELGGARIFEVDHPSTQALKRERLPQSSAAYVPWDFERRDTSELPAAVAAAGFDASRPVLAIWEGVTMYLSEGAVDASVRAVSSLSAAGSTFVFTYVTPPALVRRGLMERLVRRLVAGRGEPLVFAFEPAALSSWLHERGFTLALDTSFGALAKAMLPARYHAWFDDETNRIAVARR